MTENKWAHLESAAQIIIGSLLAQAILFAFGVQFGMALQLNIAMLSVSYARQYAIRRYFARLRDVREARDKFYVGLAKLRIPRGSL